MKITNLLVTSVNITEDEYEYKGLFILKSDEKNLNVNLADLEENDTLEKIKAFFDLEEDISVIKKTIMDKVIESAGISSKISEGENYEGTDQVGKMAKTAGSLDMA